MGKAHRNGVSFFVFGQAHKNNIEKCKMFGQMYKYIYSLWVYNYIVIKGDANMTKLSKTQKNLLEEIIHDIDYVKSFETANDYIYETRIKGHEHWYKGKPNPSDAKFDRVRENWEQGMNNQTIVYAKTETVKKLETLGYIKVVRTARWKGDAELVQLLKRA